MKTAFFWVVEIDGYSIESTYLTAPVWLSCRIWLTAFPPPPPSRVIHREPPACQPYRQIHQSWDQTWRMTMNNLFFPISFGQALRFGQLFAECHVRPHFGWSSSFEHDHDPEGDFSLAGINYSIARGRDSTAGNGAINGSGDCRRRWDGCQ